MSGDEAFQKTFPYSENSRTDIREVEFLWLWLNRNESTLHSMRVFE